MGSCTSSSPDCDVDVLVGGWSPAILASVVYLEDEFVRIAKCQNLLIVKSLIFYIWPYVILHLFGVSAAV